MSFTKRLIKWYGEHKRELPWRDTTDPYIIWLSEIILQQTRVEQGTPYFHKFVENYPTVKDFAAASEDEILNHWQGLGYYSRGRNMHYTAKMVMEDHAGYFPTNYDTLLRLKGIGEYTAAAISSFAVNEPKAVVDGNVFRLLSRYFGIEEPINSLKGKKLFTKIANELLDKTQPGLFNQAMMEFGSLQCKPKNPYCGICPMQPNCRAFNEGTVISLPVKIKSGTSRNRYFNYLVIIKNGQVLMSKRGPNDIWENLYELPLIETQRPCEAHELINSDEIKKNWGKDIQLQCVTGPVKHILSHQNLFAQFITVENMDVNIINKQYFFIDIDRLDELAQPKLIFGFFKNFFNLK
ncbi:MAG TPA: A/G-specific adenine glycosylase [Sphingobacteriaceae bacterium]|nr:A/G-specific adenine glycosylase [Sphingobacteriaceae bacterium]